MSFFDDIDWGKLDRYANDIETASAATSLAAEGTTLATGGASGIVTVPLAIGSNIVGAATDAYQMGRSLYNRDWAGAGQNALELGLNLVGLKFLSKGMNMINKANRIRNTANITTNAATRTRMLNRANKLEKVGKTKRFYGKITTIGGDIRDAIVRPYIRYSDYKRQQELADYRQGLENMELIRQSLRKKKDNTIKQNNTKTAVDWFDIITGNASTARQKTRPRVRTAKQPNYNDIDSIPKGVETIIRRPDRRAITYVTRRKDSLNRKNYINVNYK